MEWYKMAIVVVMFIIVICGTIWAYRDTIRRYNEITYVYTKTGNKYLVLGVVKAKHPDTGEWYKAVRYSDIQSRKEYIREYKDFLDKFVSLKEWENGGR